MGRGRGRKQAGGGKLGWETDKKKAYAQPDSQTYTSFKILSLTIYSP